MWYLFETLQFSQVSRLISAVICGTLAVGYVRLLVLSENRWGKYLDDCDSNENHDADLESSNADCIDTSQQYTTSRMKFNTFKKYTRKYANHT